MAVRIIAEAGVNHNGDTDRALALVDAAAAAGADAVKFQTFDPDRLVSRAAPKAEYQKKTTGHAESQRDMLRKLALDEAAHRALAARCADRGIAFLSSPFDHQSLEFLVRGLGLDTLKLGSGEITNGPLLLAAGRSGCDLILSTGMSDLAEIAEALGVVAYGLLGGANPSRRAFAGAFDGAEGRGALAAKVTLLHCTTEYPAPFAEVNLRAMATMARIFGLPVGLSDHTPGIAVAVAAAARGAVVIEKHLTLDRNLPGPDHRASLEPAELADLVRSVREVEAALGDGDKIARPSEIPNRAIARKSLVAARAISQGEVFTSENLAAKRPGGGLSPMAYWDMLGRTASRAYAADELIEE